MASQNHSVLKHVEFKRNNEGQGMLMEVNEGEFTYTSIKVEVTPDPNIYENNPDLRELLMRNVNEGNLRLRQNIKFTADTGVKGDLMSLRKFESFGFKRENLFKIKNPNGSDYEILDADQNSVPIEGGF